MKKNLYLDLYNKWRDQPFARWGVWIIIFIFYYLFVVGALSDRVTSLQDAIETKKTDLIWMANSVKKIKQLQLLTPFKQIKNQGTVFSTVNLAINETGWKKLVTDVHQINVDQVQVSFKDIPFTDFLAWVEKLYEQRGVFVTQATLQKKQPGLVDVTIVLTRRPFTVGSDLP